MYFDTSFYEEISPNKAITWEEGGGVIFKLVARLPSRTDRVVRQRERERISLGYVDKVYLCLYNHHNGYYGHGFDFTIKTKPIKNGIL